MVSDGIELGTIMAGDIHPGTNSSNISKITVIDDLLLFSADDGMHGQELWIMELDESASVGEEAWLRYGGGEW